MATTSDIFCDICAAQDLTNLAIKWCPECEEALCSDCIKQHSISKLSRKHATIGIEDHKKLPDFVSSIPRSCEEHDEKFQMFCTHHDAPCCGQCIVYKHYNCQGLLPISDILNNAKTSSTIQNVQDTLLVIRKNIEIIIKDRTQNMRTIESQLNSVRDVIKEIREKLLKHLDKLENDLLTELEYKETNIKQITDKVLKDLKEKDLKVQEYQENLKAIKEFGTDIQTYFGTREVVKYAESEQMHMNALFCDGTLNNVNIQFELNDNICICLNAENVGKLLITTTESELKQVERKEKAAQIETVNVRSKSIDEIKVTLKTKFRISKGPSGMTITGCDVTADGKLVFADWLHNKRIVVHTMDGTYINEVSVSPMSAFDVSVIDEQNVIVSNYNNNTFHKLNILNKTVFTKFKTSNNCYGLTHVKDGKVVCAVYKQGIVSYDMKENLSTTIGTEALGDCSSVTCFLDKIYYTNKSDYSVTCLNPNGEVIWTFVDQSLIKLPRGIATDQHGNVFVSSQGNNSIVVISADGKHGRKILDKKDGINDAWAMCCDKIRNKLVVANCSGDVFVFDIL